MKRKVMFLTVWVVFFALATIASAGIEDVSYDLEQGKAIVAYVFDKGDNPWNIYKELFPGQVTLEKVKAEIMIPNGIENPRRIPVGKKIQVVSSELNYLVPDNLLRKIEKIENKAKEINNIVSLQAEQVDKLNKQVNQLSEALAEKKGFRTADRIFIWLALIIIIVLLLWNMIFRKEREVVRHDAPLSVFLAFVILPALLFTGCGGPKMAMKNVNFSVPITGAGSVQSEGIREEHVYSMLIQPHQSLGLEPTPSICRGDIDVYLFPFPSILSGEYFPGRLRWNAWLIRPDKTETFGQFIFAGMHPSGAYYGPVVIDYGAESGQMVLLSSDMNFIYGPFQNEVAINKEKFQNEPPYRTKKIVEANTDSEGQVFDISYLTPVPGLKSSIRNWNQIQFPEGYLLSPYGAEEVASIRGINPQYSYFQKLVGTGKFGINPFGDPIGIAVGNSIGIMMDLINALKAPSTGWDYNSELPSRRNMALINQYFLSLAQGEVHKRNLVNAKLIQAQGAPGR